jgi:hypothetical protein
LDEERLDWLSGKVMLREIILSGRDLPVAINLRSAIDYMMFREAEKYKASPPRKYKKGQSQ